MRLLLHGKRLDSAPWMISGAEQTVTNATKDVACVVKAKKNTRTTENYVVSNTGNNGGVAQATEVEEDQGQATVTIRNFP